MSTVTREAWRVIIPVKSLESAKSRLGPHESARRPSGGLALAFFRDTATAVRDCPAVGTVIIATHDAVVSDIARQMGCQVIDESGHPGINAAAAWAYASLQTTGPVAVAVSDLPCLTPSALSAVLAGVGDAERAFVPDADESGTTIWMSATGRSVVTQFGAHSAAAHLAAGALPMTSTTIEPAALSRARRDVDTDADLADALALGVGQFTAAAVQSIRSTSPGALVTALRRRADGSLEVADEDGARHVVAWDAVTAAGFRDVRPGQRLLLRAGTVQLPK